MFAIWLAWTLVFALATWSSLQFSHYGFGAFWLPDGILVASILCPYLKDRGWAFRWIWVPLGYFLAAICVGPVRKYPVPTIVLGLVNVFHCLLIAAIIVFFLLKRSEQRSEKGEDFCLDRWVHVCAFVFAAIFGAFICATLSAVLQPVLWPGSERHSKFAFSVWIQRISGHTIGTLIVMPLCYTIVNILGTTNFGTIFSRTAIRSVIRRRYTAVEIMKNGTTLLSLVLVVALPILITGMENKGQEGVHLCKARFH
ncbi:hypothetical protein HK102_005336 [Quaeritorhiza haematococci]|nr:hypothetical protein HK102_005336 [Quaeritorhiza haematococci]